MPEGDTIHKIANAMAERLEGESVRTLRLAHRGARREVSGASVEAVYAHGKHLFVDLDDGNSLRVHLGMYGSWHRYRAGRGWPERRQPPSVVLETDAHVFVCHHAKEVELMPSAGIRARALRGRLGPDLVRDGWTVPALLARVAALHPPDAEIDDVLLDQRVAAGIGNVYKSELLFIHRVPPTRSVAQVGDDVVAALYESAAALLARNLGGGPRRTRFVTDGRGRLWVYARADAPCLRCVAPVRRLRSGRQRRVTFFCAGCQGEPD